MGFWQYEVDSILLTFFYVLLSSLGELTNIGRAGVWQHLVHLPGVLVPLQQQCTVCVALMQGLDLNKLTAPTPRTQSTGAAAGCVAARM
jgi:hypothetical protein